MTLREKLGAHKAGFLSKASPEAVAIMQGAEAELRASGILDRILREGDRAPAFALPDAEGQTVRSDELLSQGPLLVSFYRGGW